MSAYSQGHTDFHSIQSEVVNGSHKESNQTSLEVGGRKMRGDRLIEDQKVARRSWFPLSPWDLLVLPIPVSPQSLLTPWEPFLWCQAWVFLVNGK